MRKGLTSVMVVMGIVCAVFGYMASAPWSAVTAADADPSFVAAPLLFVLGLILLIGAAIVYELLPERR